MINSLHADLGYGQIRLPTTKMGSPRSRKNIPLLFKRYAGLRLFGARVLCMNAGD